MSRIARVVHVSHLVLSPKAPVTDDDQPIVSERPFYLGLGDVLPHTTVERSGETWAKKFEGILVERRFPSRPSPDRLGTSLPPPGSPLIPTHPPTSFKSAFMEQGNAQVRIYTTI